MGNSSYNFDTLKVKGGYNPSEHNYSVQVPIYQTASYEPGGPEKVDNIRTHKETGFLYSRMSNPTAAVLEKRIAELHGASGAIATSSGAAAVSYALLAIAEGGGRIITTNQLYGGTLGTLIYLFSKFGIEVDVVNIDADIDEYAKVIKEDTKVIFVESISNPTVIPVDIEKISKLAHDNNIPLVVDNTIATPYLLNPFEFGADIVVYSATKGISGHGSAIGGLIIQGKDTKWTENKKFNQFHEKRFALRDDKGSARNFLEAFPEIPYLAKVNTDYAVHLGASLSSFDAYLILIGLETLSERLNKTIASTIDVIKYLEKNENVEWISYPSLENGSYKDLSKKYFPKGAGGVFAFGTKGDKEEVYKFLNSLKIFSYQLNIGDARSLVTNPPKSTHFGLTEEELINAKVPLNTIRISIGLEDPTDLIKDLEQAFQIAFN
ncbi:MULTISPECIES: aminotransferase class I/II-fold pyridoxal phosphate-dependent enzyme [unclassified Clostridium]|uniref:O-acetylhomoserine aminocarboxypropyltransferase/cysteine synthase family protein n=1 Tax=unclassified Clostridium TaxID=2614128 RepID=UPI0002977D56|nr:MULTISPECIES: aminotransferase class I/II-fold pyridoxal phosphate-dependent enzyme [unclassified Clostridium]EKQ53820.1 MAG: O-acetylhomoserine sulfhydrylase [Clostridium sp. Maddingley MBC34-26]